MLTTTTTLAFAFSARSALLPSLAYLTHTCAQVVVGDMEQKLQADYDADKLPKGKLSVFGAGKMGPSLAKPSTLPDGCEVPNSKLKPTGVKGGSLLYNEYVVYDVSQVRMRYLVKLKFKFK